MHRQSSRVPPSITRRSAVAAALGLTAAAALPKKASSATQPLAGTTLVFASAGGSYQDAEKVSYCDPFSAKTGAVVTQDGPAMGAKLRGMIESGTSDWDVVDVSTDFMFAGMKDNLFEKIDTSVVHTSRVDPHYVNDYGVGAIVYSRTLGYNTKIFGGAKRPQSWRDMFDLSGYPGQRMLPNDPTGSLEVALLADGVSPDKLYPLDLDRALKKLDTIKSKTVFWATSAQSQQLLADAEVGLGLILNGRAYDLVKRNVPVEICWSQNIQTADYFVVPRGSRNVKAAMMLIDEATLPENQAKLANLIAYAPTNAEAYKSIDPSVTPWLSTAPQNRSQGLLLNASYYRDNLKMLQERWTKWKVS